MSRIYEIATRLDSKNGSSARQILFNRSSSLLSMALVVLILVGSHLSSIVSISNPASMSDSTFFLGFVHSRRC